MYLLLWGSFLSLCWLLVSHLVKLLISLTCNITEYEISLRKSIRDLKKELSKISMQDQFALYAKTERKINKLSEKLSNCTSARSVQVSKASWAYTLTFHAILGLTMTGTMWSYGSTPVLVLPSEWTFPISWTLSLPTGVPGGIGLPLWMGLTSAILKLMPSLPNFGINKEYRQLPLD